MAVRMTPPKRTGWVSRHLGPRKIGAIVVAALAVTAAAVALLVLSPTTPHAHANHRVVGATASASASSEFPGEADLSNPVAPKPASPPCSLPSGQGVDRCITAGIEILQGHLGEGWFHATDSWSSAQAPPASVPGSGTFSVQGIRPGLALVYQIHDVADKATGYWIGAKFFSPTNGFKSNASECFVYQGNPMTSAGHKTLSSPYKCLWIRTTGENPRPNLVVKLAGTAFPGDAEISTPLAQAGEQHLFGSMNVKVPSLGDGWSHGTDVWSATKPPPGTVAKGTHRFEVTGLSPGLVLLYQIYDQAGKPTGYWIGAKFSSPSYSGYSSECVVYKGNPMTTAGHKAPSSPYVCQANITRRDYRSANLALDVGAG
jgi:hypothetical protein